MSYSNTLKELYDQVYKLTLAVLRTTDLFSRDEVLKRHINEKAIDIFEEMIQGQSLSIKGEINSIKGLFEIVRGRQLINEINISVFSKEYDKLSSLIDQQMNNSRQSDKKDEEVRATNKNLYDDFYPEKNSNNAQKDYKKENLGHQIQKTEKIPLAENSAGLNDRQSMILNHIKQINQAKISDFYSMFSNISSKTIQRDLQDLVSKNLLKKEGDKRWTIYSLINVQ